MSGISLDEILEYSVGAGAVDSSTLRVELSTESLAALENISVFLDSAARIRIWDGTDELLINTDGSLNVVATPAVTTTILNSVGTVTTTAAQVVASALTARKNINIQNEGTADVFIGSTAGVTSANGTKISKNSSANFDWGSAVAIFMIAGSGSQSVRFLETA